MKLITQALYCIIICLSAISCATVGKIGATDTLKKGSLLTYQIDHNSPFYVKVKELSNEQIAFQYYFGKESEGGIIEIPKVALNHGPDLKNYFSNNDWGETLILSDETSVWMAKNVFKDLKKDKRVTIDVGNGKEDWILSGEESWGVESNTGEDVMMTCLVFVDENPDTYREIWVNDDENNPLILQMQLDFHIQLNKIEF